MNKILLTGASGFIGGAVYKYLLEHDVHELIVTTRSSLNHSDPFNSVVEINAIDASTDWTDALRFVNVVIHSAARAHIMNDIAVDPLAEFRKVNTEGTINLARQAAASGVKRFIFISSIKVNGEQTILGQPYKVEDSPAPCDAYGVSKMEAEIGLRALAEKTNMEVVIIRPVLVYGPGVKANFLNMMSWLNQSIPLPLGAIHNKRSLVALDNLVDLINVCIDHPKAANQTFLISDDEDLSTTELLQRMAKALHKSAWLLPVPSSLLKVCASLLGKRSIAQRLCGSLQVDIGKTRKLLNWAPPTSVDNALLKSAKYFQENVKK